MLERVISNYHQTRSGGEYITPVFFTVLPTDGKDADTSPKSADHGEKIVGVCMYLRVVSQANDHTKLLIRMKSYSCVERVFGQDFPLFSIVIRLTEQRYVDSCHFCRVPYAEDIGHSHRTAHGRTARIFRSGAPLNLSVPRDAPNGESRSRAGFRTEHGRLRHAGKFLDLFVKHISIPHAHVL